MPLLAAPPAAARRGGDIVPGRYIVVYKQSVSNVGAETDTRERELGFSSRLRYRHTLKGFAARLSPGQVRRLEADRDVASVTADRFVHATLAPGETAPTGIRRIRASVSGSANPASRVNVAVIDTGVGPHPDLNVVSGTNCVSPGSPANDDNGHGTHVAGTIAAGNTGPPGGPVVGVVPATTVYAVKVLDSTGSGTWSQVICGIDWVTTNAAAANIGVANMSLGGGGTAADMNACGATTPLHQAICNSTANVAYAVAAGNSGWDYDYAPVPDVPAAYPEALTVAAMSDSDGLPGASGGSPNCRTGESDDRYASFSNYAATSGGRAHTLAAPGVCILSDWLGGGTNTISGTSMAAPHVTGAIAHCNGDAGGAPGPCAGLTRPGDLIPKITSTDPSYGYFGDPSRPVSGAYFGYLALAGTPPPPLPTFTVSASPSSRTVARGGGTTYTVTVQPANGFTGSVNLSVSGLPSPTSASFAPNPTKSSSTLTVRTSSRTARGTFTLTVKGTSGSLTRTTTVKLVVT